jgi:ureidoglycolate hydrolase
VEPLTRAGFARFGDVIETDGAAALPQRYLIELVAL